MSSRIKNKSITSALRALSETKERRNSQFDFYYEKGREYFRMEPQSDLISFSRILQIPAELHEFYVASKFKCSYGILPSINRYYAIIDEKVFFWPLNSNIVSEKWCEFDTDFIISIQETTAFISETEFSPAIAIATPNYIKIITVVDNKIDFERFNVIKTPFKTSVMAQGPPGILFCGGYDGDLYVVKTSLKNQIENGTSSFIKKVFLSLIGHSMSPICGLRTDPWHTNVCFWTENNSVTFLEFDQFEEKFTRSETFQKDDIISIDDDSEIIFCECIGNFIFEVVDSHGTRYIFRGRKQEKQSFTPLRLPEEVDAEFIDGSLSMGCLCLVSEKEVLYARSHKVDKDKYALYYTVGDLPGDYIASAFGVKTCVRDSSNSFYWQHKSLPPSAFILTLGGAFTVKFAPPLEKIKRMICNYEEDINKDSDMNLDTENLASLITIARERPEIREKCFYVANKIIKESGGKETFSQAAYICILSVMDDIIDYPILTRIPRQSWGSDAFGSRKNDWIVTDIFKIYHNNTVLYLNGIKEVIESYIEECSAVRDVSSATNALVRISDYNALVNIVEYIKYTTQMISLATILGQQSVSDITNTIELMLEQNPEIERFLERPLFTLDYNIDQKINIALMKNIIGYLFIVTARNRQSDALGEEISQRVPVALDTQPKVIEIALNDLQNAKLIEGQDKLKIVGRAMNSLLQCISSRYLKVNEVFVTLQELDSPSYIYQLAIAKVRSIDPYRHALLFSKSSKNKDDKDEVDKEGEKIFGEVYDIYEHAVEGLDCTDGLDEALFYANEDELFALTIYSGALERGMIEDLIAANPPFIEEFIKKNARNLLYKVYVVKGENEKAVDELYDIIKSSVCTTKKRMDWISKARVLANGTQSKHKNDIEEAYKRTIYIQQLYLASEDEALSNKGGSFELDNKEEPLKDIEEIYKIISRKCLDSDMYKDLFVSFLNDNKFLLNEHKEEIEKEVEEETTDENIVKKRKDAIRRLVKK